jgi:hypothetical protein
VRLLAFGFLALAALDVAVPFLDRAGLAAAGVACLALSLPPRPRRIRRPAMPAVPARVVELDEEDEPELGATAARVADYLAIAGRST